MYGPRHGRLVARRQAAGKIVAGACTSGAETDQKTIDCLVKAALKALDFVEDPELDSPECLAPELPFALTRAAALLDDFHPLLFCGSPSAAFVAFSAVP